MTPRARVGTAALVLALGLAVLAGWGCSKKIRLPVVVDQRPVLHLTMGPASTTEPYSYAYEIRWIGFDPDGAIVRYEYVVDPPSAASAETLWTSTTSTRQTFVFRSDDPDSLGTKDTPRGYHVFVLRAVDDAGLYSEPIVRAFFSYTVAPTVRIVKPILPNHLIVGTVPPTVTFRWTGSDPDGQGTLKPVKYKYRLFTRGDPDFPLDLAVLHPDSLRKAFAPAFAGWDSTTTDTTAHYDALTPGATYLFVVVAWDEAGAYSPVFSLDENMLYFRADFAGSLGPRLTVWSQYFYYAYLSGGFDPDPVHAVPVQVPYSQPVTVKWSGQAASGTTVQAYRWVLDIGSLDDETPRSDQNTDVTHWSAWSGAATSATVGPFLDAVSGGPASHHFYVEARDDNGTVSLGHLRLDVVTPQFTKDLLFVKDTRFAVDNKARGSDSLLAPGGLWPSEAELDTFFFARGGVRWKYYPAGTLSRPGIFQGYAFDTLSTHALPGGVVTLSLLSQYRHVVWSVDQAALFLGPPYYGWWMSPMPCLRYLSGPSVGNALATYIGIGGSVWLQGGGGAYNSLVPWNSTSNDGGGTVFSYDAGELVPGRLMYDLAGWRSEATVRASATRTFRMPARAPGGWPGAPDYTLLPATLAGRSPSTDPIPPLRGYGTFYPTSTDVEYVSRPNAVLEAPAGGGPAASVLDSLYVTNTGLAPAGMPVMTFYHGSRASMLFGGFPLWYLQRAQAIQVADFVLQQMWGLPRQPVAR